MLTFDLQKGTFLSAWIGAQEPGYYYRLYESRSEGQNKWRGSRSSKGLSDKSGDNYRNHKMIYHDFQMSGWLTVMPQLPLIIVFNT